MSIQFVVDMNLSAEWVTELANHGWPAVHWSTVGDAKADDEEIMQWAIQNDRVVFTHDLDFGTALALTHAIGPSVLLIRGQNVLPEDIGAVVVEGVRRHESELASGALVVVDVKACRVRVLPF